MTYKSVQSPTRYKIGLRDFSPCYRCLVIKVSPFGFDFCMSATAMAASSPLKGGLVLMLYDDERVKDDLQERLDDPA
jgi:hypothetical protein